MDGKTTRREGDINAGPAPTITVTYPMKGHNLEPGTYQTITWDKTGLQDDQVRIKLMHGDAEALNLSSNTENDGSFTWQAPLTLESAADYTIRIENQYMPLKGDSEPFGITTKKITYLWDFGDNNETTEANPIHTYAKPGHYAWSVEISMEGITCTKGGAITFPGPYIMITSPKKGDKLPVGAQYTITWIKSQITDQRVKIELLKDGVTVQTITAQTANDGRYDWRVPANQEPGGGYALYMEAEDSGVNRVGGSFEIIVSPGIPDREREALIALYNSANGDEWTDNGGWKTEPLHADGFAAPGTERTCKGVSVGENNGVKEIVLNNNNLRGVLPPQLGNLTKLTLLRINHNNLTGEIPTTLTSLTALTQTDIGYNALYTNDETLRAFLAQKDPDWEKTQTEPPTYPGKKI